MNRLFEMFVFRLLDTLLAKADVRIHYQRADRSIILNASTGQPYARVVPDILVERIAAGTTARLAIDAKYKLYDERKLSSSDVYQSFLYVRPRRTPSRQIERGGPQFLLAGGADGSGTD
jgi:5-methylcytosine-specific restriction enzyme subunit McrC